MMHFELKDPFNLYKKCSKCGFEICIGSADSKATIEDWKHCPKCGHKEKVFKKDKRFNHD